MRKLKREDLSELELGLELELESEDVNAAVAAVAAASEGQIPCSCCDELFSTTEDLHSHQVEHHSLSELSLALITLRGLDLSLVNGAFDIHGAPSDDNSSHLRNILMEYVDRPHDCDSESTVTVSSEARLATVSPPSSPAFSSLHGPMKFSSWTGRVASPSHSSTPSHVNGRQVMNFENNSTAWSDYQYRSMMFSDVKGHTKSKQYIDKDSRQFFCHLCERRYKKKSHLERHLRAHTGVRPYACPTCDKRFAVRSILKQHIRVHTGEKPFSCNICFQRFPQKSGLMTHMMLHNGKPFKCAYCVKSFVSNHKLMLHQRSHRDLLNRAPNQGPYCCLSCDMHFFTTGALSEHLKIHDSRLDQPSRMESCTSDEVTISEEAARVAATAVDIFPEMLLEAENMYNYIPDFGIPLSEFQDDLIKFEDEPLNVVKTEVFDDDDDDDDDDGEDSPNESFFCEARWSGIDDMYIGADFSNVC